MYYFVPIPSPNDESMIFVFAHFSDAEILQLGTNDTVTANYMCSAITKRFNYTRDLRIAFFAFESNLESNRPSDSISNRISRIYLIHSIGIYFVFVTNESDARN